MADISVRSTSLVVVVRRIFCFVLFCFVFLPVMLPSEIQKLPTDSLVRGFPGIWKLLLLHTPFPGWVSIPILSHFLSYILSCLLSKRIGCLSRYPVSSANIQKLFCGSCSAFKWSLDEFVGGKVISPSYSSAIYNSFPQNYSC